MKTLFLLGAGASSPFLKDSSGCLNTKRLTKELLKSKNWADILSLYEKIRANCRPKSSADNISQVDIELIFNRITVLLGKTVEFKNFNFEHIIHLLDRFSFYFSCDQGIKEYGMIDVLPIMLWPLTLGKNENDDFIFKKIFSTGTGHQGWRYIPLLAREIISSIIFQIWNNFPNKDNAIKSYREYFEETFTRCDSINIYSQNYDPLLCTALKTNKGFCDGFTYQDFNIKRFFEASSVLAFLHGHIGFVGPCFVDDYSKAQNDRLKALIQSAGAYKTGMKGVSYNTYLITGLDKFDAFSQNPFACYFQRFGKDVNESDCLVIIGASLQDDHLSSMLINYLAQKGGKVVYVTLMSIDQIKACVSRNRSADENPFLVLMGFFKDNYVSYEPPLNEAWTKHINQLCESVEKLGYGKLTDNVVLYAGGSEDFFKKKEKLQSILDVLKN